MLTSAVDHYERQARLTAAGLVAARRKRWTDSLSIAQIVALFQIQVAQESLDSIDSMLDEQGIHAPLAGSVAARSFAGTASDGRPLQTLFQQAASPEALGLMIVTQLQDAARAASAVSIAARPRIGYVRMLSAGACSRCAILAGKFYRYNRGFLRHPHCACRHIPTAENISGELTTDPDTYFASLSTTEQDRIFTKAGAEAIRLGANVGQVVNARRVTAGMQFAGAPAIKRQFGNLYTTEGTTVRARAYQQQLALRRSGVPQQRLMPETILDVAKDREDAQRLLRLYGYIGDDAAIAQGRAVLAERRRLARNARARERRAERRSA